MTKLVPTAKKLVVGAVAAGALSFGVAGVAGAAPALLTGAPAVKPHFNCARATKLLVRIERTRSEISAGLPDLHKAEAKAKAHGKTKRAARLEKVIARLESPQLQGRLTKASQAIEAKCHVPAPAGTTGT